MHGALTARVRGTVKVHRQSHQTVRGAVASRSRRRSQLIPNIAGQLASGQPPAYVDRRALRSANSWPNTSASDPRSCQDHESSMRKPAEPSEIFPPLAILLAVWFYGATVTTDELPSRIVLPEYRPWLTEVELGELSRQVVTSHTPWAKPYGGANVSGG